MFEKVLGSGSIRQVTLGSMTALAVYVCGAGLTACSQFLIAHFVDAHTFGLYSYVLAWVTVLAYFSALGFDIALLRFVSAYRADGAWARLRGVIQYAERRMFAASACVIAIGVTAIMIPANRMSTELKETFLAGFALVPIWALLWMRSSLGRVFGSVLSAIVPDRVVRDGLLIGLVVLMHATLHGNLDAPLIMMATVVSAATALALATLAVRRLRPREIDGVAPDYDIPVWRSTILPLMIITAAEAVLNRGGVLVLGWLGATKDAGIYALVFSISFLVALPRTAANTLLAPTISDLFVRRQHQTLQNLIVRMSLWTLCCAVSIALVLALIAGPLLSWFGPSYEAGVPALRILLIGQAIAASCGSQLSIMTMTGLERRAAIVLAVSGVINVLLAAALVKLLGLPGAAIATTLTLVGWNIVMAAVIWRDLKLIPAPAALLQTVLNARIAPGAPRRSRTT